MPSADKRQRKKDNARQAREAREAAAKRKRRFRGIRNAAITAAVVVVGIVIFNFVLSSGDDDNTASDSTSTTTPTDESTTPESTTPPKTVPAAALAAVTCDTEKPASPPKNTDQSEPATPLDETKTYTATISTSCGDIEVDLDEKNAPDGVNNFVTLAKQGFYDGLTWHRAVKDFVIQGGDPDGNGNGGPGYSFVTELPKDGYPLGALAWAKTGDAPAGSAGSQFFVVTADRPAALEAKQNDSYQYGAFGTVTKGIEVAKKIEGFAPESGDGAPTQSVYINKVTITES